MLVKDFDYELPKELIAQEPSQKRDESRLLVLARSTGEIQEGIFRDIINYLNKNEVLVLNQTRVIPARIYGDINDRKVELLLIRRLSENIWEALARPARKLKPGTIVKFKSGEAKIVERKPTGIRIVEFIGVAPEELLRKEGEIALPPYINNPSIDINRYQTVYAQKNGSVAAPTAGLHFTEELLEKIKDKGVEILKITLHASLGTFRPVKAEKVEEHKMYEEEFELPEDVAQKINEAKLEGRRVIAVGTTVVRTLEAQAKFKKGNVWQVVPEKGSTDLFIYPGYEFKIVDAMITNFHLPKSTLLMLVCAFASKEYIFRAYEYAIKNR
ncbi:MAG: tRNA preQ1(34) S-adenosylmethionine ribosyltransferase-isomerase QueA, partial [candidate division WOR-3 bacterium]|nr:tRNA preQ1(34) S-adenosylmethionine ribosyltransferase-isomerase QueA [candidate division WOR-3 bacterium]